MTSEGFTPGALSVGIEPHLFVIFGGTGDLARSKLLPGLYQLFRRREFTDRVRVLGVATRDIGEEAYRTLCAEALAEAGHTDAGEWVERSVHYFSIKKGFDAFYSRVASIEEEAGLGGNRVFYLAVPPSVFPDTLSELGKQGLIEGRGWSRVVVEKPFGTDLASSRELNHLLHSWFAEEQVYRIDHYLAKETVQNLMALRFANPLFESSWTRDRIESVQLTVAEDIGIGTRAGYYDKAGAVRDIVQNHALQIFSLVAMEPPVRATAEHIRDEKVKVLKATRAIGEDEIVRGRYTAGRIGDDPVVGYLEEPGVEPDSTTETFAAMRLSVDNWRWQDVPFFVRAGKRLATRVTQVSVVFREPPVSLFRAVGECEMHPNVFDIRLQPSEGFALSFEMKVPGEGYSLQTQRLRFDYDQAFGELPDAYTTLLADVMSGDQTLFVRSDEVEEAWRVVGETLDLSNRPHQYAAGSWGPEAANDLLVSRGHHWLQPTF